MSSPTVAMSGCWNFWTIVPLIDYARQLNRGVLIKKALNSGHASDAAASLRLAVDYPGVSSVIVGTINPAHLTDNIRALNQTPSTVLVDMPMARTRPFSLSLTRVSMQSLAPRISRSLPSE